jgi:hypothetical protein
MNEENVVSPSDDRSGFDAVVMNLDFGDYCCIEQKRYGAENEIYQYKVIGRGRANYYRPVPVDDCAPHNERGDMCDVLKVICCGVSETKVETFRVQDVKPSHFKGRFNS